jgi:hypothetical protein
MANKSTLTQVLPSKTGCCAAAMGCVVLTGCGQGWFRGDSVAFCYTPAMLRGVLFAALVAALLPSLAFAWGGDGHQLVCLIAEDRLKPEAKAGIHALLGKQGYRPMALCGHPR